MSYRIPGVTVAKVTNLVLLETAISVAVFIIFAYEFGLGASSSLQRFLVGSSCTIFVIWIGFSTAARYIRTNNKNSVWLQPVSDRFANVLVNLIVFIWLLFVATIVAIVLFHFNSVRLILVDSFIILAISAYGIYFIRHNKEENALVFGILSIVMLLIILMSIPIFK